MIIFKVIPKSKVIGVLSVIFFIFICSLLLIFTSQENIAISVVDSKPEWESYIHYLFNVKNNCILNHSYDTLKSIYVTDEKKGLWAYENEILRSKYLYSWSEKQGAVFLDINSEVKLLSSKHVGRGYAFYIFCSTEYSYAYADDIKNANKFTLGTYHSFDLIPESENGNWAISREWYDDIFMKSICEFKSLDDIRKYVAGNSRKGIIDLDEKRITAVEYADNYCGAFIDRQNFGYNKEYTDYNSLGGDCANFASQVLYEGGGFKKNVTWNYKSAKGSYSWIKARGLKDYLLYNGKGFLVAKGKYENVYKLAYELLPGDMIFYADRGKVTHVSVVTDHDSKGYPLVNSHNLDRYHVPWDIGWNDDNTTYYLIHLHYC